MSRRHAQRSGRPAVSPVTVRRIENGLVALAVVAAFTHLGFAWWWLFALFLVVDLSAIGYLWGPRAGALGYNVGHSYAIPAALAAVWLWQGGDQFAFAALVWGFHIAVDRAMGYGLKLSAGFHATDLGGIGPDRQAGPRP